MFKEDILYIFNLTDNGTAAAYDEAVAASTLQGIINRNGPQVYVISPRNKRPGYWLELFKREGEWLHGKKLETIEDLDGLARLAGSSLKGAVIWDPGVPATINLANTIAGVEDGVVLSPEYAERYLPRWKLEVIKDLRGMFTGSHTGSAKNDAYRWAIENYLSKGLCSPHLLCLYEDSFQSRDKGDISYVITRDWAVKNKSFVFDLSPWGDEKPGDDLDQPMGTDLQTYRILLEEVLKQTRGQQMTELAGFFCFNKYCDMPGHPSSHHDVATEWETVYLISPYNCYQNTVAGDCYNQSFHSWFPFKPLKQHRPYESVQLQNKLYACFHMCDYDSTTPLYEYLPDFWHNEKRGEIPLPWGINPNLIETYPDIISYVYRTASPNDYFVADASAAGYFNPSRIREEYLSLMIEHNKKFFDLTDMTIAPMVLDWVEPSPSVKDAFTRFSPDGYATIIEDFHDSGAKGPIPHVWKGMSILNMNNVACNYESTEINAKLLLDTMKQVTPQKPEFLYIRIVWASPAQIIGILEELRKQRPDLDIVPVDPYNFFRLFKTWYGMSNHQAG